MGRPPKAAHEAARMRAYGQALQQRGTLAGSRSRGAIGAQAVRAPLPSAGSQRKADKDLIRRSPGRSAPAANPSGGRFEGRTGGVRRSPFRHARPARCSSACRSAGPGPWNATGPIVHGGAFRDEPAGAVRAVCPVPDSCTVSGRRADGSMAPVSPRRPVGETALPFRNALPRRRCRLTWTAPASRPSGKARGTAASMALRAAASVGRPDRWRGPLLAEAPSDRPGKRRRTWRSRLPPALPAMPSCCRNCLPGTRRTKRKDKIAMGTADGAFGARPRPRSRAVLLREASVPAELERRHGCRRSEGMPAPPRAGNAGWQRCLDRWGILWQRAGDGADLLFRRDPVEKLREEQGQETIRGAVSPANGAAAPASGGDIHRPDAVLRRLHCQRTLRHWRRRCVPYVPASQSFIGLSPHHGRSPCAGALDAGAVSCPAGRCTARPGKGPRARGREPDGNRPAGFRGSAVATPPSLSGAD